MVDVWVGIFSFPTLEGMRDLCSILCVDRGMRDQFCTPK